MMSPQRAKTGLRLLAGPRLLAGLALLLLGACGTTEPSRLYTLSAIPDRGSNASGPETPAIGIGPVTLPKYLDRPQIVERSGPNRLVASEFDRWAEPLIDTVPRVLAEDIGRALQSDRVYVIPRRRPLPIDLTVEVDISQFEPLADGTAALAARWLVFGDRDRPLEEGSADIRIEGDLSKGYESRVELLSKALGELSRRIAESVLAIAL